MRRSSLLLSCLAVATLLSGCGSAYRSFYRETNHDLSPKPVGPEKVKVVKSADDLQTAWVELGIYRGHAPTVKEAMESARRECGKAGAEFFILNVEPYESAGHWKLDGICAARG